MTAGTTTHVEQPPSEVKYPIFSANCHFIEPRHTFEGRMPRHLADRAPKLVDAPGGGEQWVFEGIVRPLMRNCAVAGIPRSEWTPGFGMDTLRMEDIRPGCYDPVARVADMDSNGIIATVTMSSPATMGFACDLFGLTDDHELGLASLRAWNDWVIDEWVAAAPTRFVPIQGVWYHDPEVAAAEVRRNAERGFKGVTMRNPSDMGAPTFYTGKWDPFLRACEETGTVLVHHTDNRAPTLGNVKLEGFPYGASSTLFQSGAAATVVQWIWGGLPTRFPNLKVHVGESGGTWLPHTLRRLDWSVNFSPVHAEGWPEPGTSPLELLKRNFVFSTLEVDAAEAMQEQLGLDGWMLEVDYPHFESPWPETQEYYGKDFEHMSTAQVRALAWENVSRLYRHEVPAALQLPALEESAPNTDPTSH